MDAVAAEAGFSRQAIYRHFGSRAGLLTELLESIDVTEGAPRAVERVRPAESGPASIEALFEWWVDDVPRFVGIARGVLAAKHTDSDLRLAWDDRMQARGRRMERRAISPAALHGRRGGALRLTATRGRGRLRHPRREARPKSMAG